MDSLDGLRGIAVLCVALSHMSHMHMTLLIPALNFAGLGKFGVYLFFTLSAFLLTVPFYKRLVYELTAQTWTNYAFRRFTRIFPLFLIFLVASVVLTSIGIPLPFNISLHDFWQHLMLRKGEGVLWSIPVEVTYYAVLPVLVLLCSFVLRRNLVVVGLVTLGLIGISRLVWNPLDAPANSTNLGFYLPIFLSGSFAALVHYRLLQLELSKSVRLGLEVVSFACITLVILLTPSLFSAWSGQPFRYNRFHDLHTLFGVLWSVIIVTHLHGSGWLKRILCWAPLRLTGVVSFSFYLTHLPTLRVVRKLPFAGSIWDHVGGLVALVLTFILSVGLYTYIEKPLIGLSLPTKKVGPVKSEDAMPGRKPIRS